MRKPNFFIIGAPKCGTTAMSEYLRTHPNVFMSEPKEPSFFSEDVAPSNYRSYDEYLELFKNALPSHSVVAEASTRYIHSRQALSKIREAQPDAKLLAMLRHPIDLVYAFHGELFKIGNETEPDFERAWNLQLARAQGRALPPGVRGNRHPHRFQYQWIGCIGSQVKKLFEVFPRNQIHFILFDDFVTNTAFEYRKLLSFLSLPDDGRYEFPPINQAKQYKWPWLGQFSMRLCGRFSRPLTTLRRKTRFRGTGLIKALDRFNAETRPRPPLRPEFRQYLQEQFHDEVLLLQELLGQQLGSWLEDK
jgi:hypothetical protein